MTSKRRRIDSLGSRSRRNWNAASMHRSGVCVPAVVSFLMYGARPLPPSGQNEMFLLTKDRPPVRSKWFWRGNALGRVGAARDPIHRTCLSRTN